jgi:hypothetical protein
MGDEMSLDILEQKVVTIRKQCKCRGCGRTFERGARLEKLTVVEDGVFMRTAWCNVCKEYWSLYMEDGEGIGEGDLKSEDPETWEDVRSDLEHSKLIDRSQEL